ncbi:hypothetical protein BO79DRAFT_208699 [Aspergillus costaricaensis CBS 115574]|uniref:Uncharacterized protein n=1 Tax=Aspergillus costaricaensis CBS 115574 TaxID=1448317 RepID=A0ACD1IHL2_9EURO|nr:hypothetical protein BO79DRAFT_208699 [Aspergillus costaricaensis CBS 115574]RAK90059.1 hypothetical protein BO79DRAFT_208699 [Aspergillus costaricaensis CBS 115574]
MAADDHGYEQCDLSFCDDSFVLWVSTTASSLNLKCGIHPFWALLFMMACAVSDGFLFPIHWAASASSGVRQQNGQVNFYLPLGNADLQAAVSAAQVNE